MPDSKIEKNINLSFYRISFYRNWVTLSNSYSIPVTIAKNIFVDINI